MDLPRLGIAQLEKPLSTELKNERVRVPLCTEGGLNPEESHQQRVVSHMCTPVSEEEEMTQGDYINGIVTVWDSDAHTTLGLNTSCAGKGGNLRCFLARARGRNCANLARILRFLRNHITYD